MEKRGLLKHGDMASTNLIRSIEQRGFASMIDSARPRLGHFLVPGLGRLIDLFPFPLPQRQVRRGAREEISVGENFRFSTPRTEE